MYDDSSARLIILLDPKTVTRRPYSTFKFRYLSENFFALYKDCGLLFATTKSDVNARRRGCSTKTYACIYYIYIRLHGSLRLSTSVAYCMFLDLDRSQFSVNNIYSLQLTLLVIITDNQGVRARTYDLPTYYYHSRDCTRIIREKIKGLCMNSV